MELFKDFIITLKKNIKIWKKNKQKAAEEDLFPRKNIYVHVSKCKKKCFCRKVRVSTIAGEKALPSNVFHVSLIFGGPADEVCEKHLRGKLEVTEEGLLFHQEEKETISWPIRAIPRCGGNKSTFSIETGDSSQTGAGYFVFRSSYAQQIRKLLTKDLKVVPTNPRIFLVLIEE